MVGFCTFLLILFPTTVSAAEYDNALIIVADDLGVDKVGSYAGDVSNPSETRPETPTIDMLADAGVRFTDAWAMPVCSPSRVSLYSGEYPFRTGVGTAIGDASAGGLPTSPLTLQQLAQDAGLSTGLFGKWHAGLYSSTPGRSKSAFDFADYPITSGFEIFQGSVGGDPLSYTNWLHEQSKPDSTRSSGYATSATMDSDSITGVTTADALAWLRGQYDSGNRTLAVVAYNLPHDTQVKGTSSRSWADAVYACGGTPSGDKVTDQRFAVECLDDAVYGLLEGVPDLDHTLVIFIGDNGTPTSAAEGNFKDGRGKATVYESGVRVPLIVADGAALHDVLESGGTLPSGTTYGINAGSVAHSAAGIVDIYATVVDLLGLDTGACSVGTDCARDSTSMRSVLTGGADARTVNWTETFDDSTGSLYGSGAVRLGDYKLVVRTTSDWKKESGHWVSVICRKYTMYNLATDRWEKTDLLDKSAYADQQAQLMSLLEGYATEMSGTDNDWLGVDDCCGSVERWYDGRDSDCDGESDYDQDGDGYDSATYGGDDCDDTDDDISPAKAEIWYDGVDEDCDGLSDYDRDGDGYDSASYGGDDCDDKDTSFSPGVAETWYDGEDEDCDGLSDYDQDGDGHDDVEYGGDDCDDKDFMTWLDAPDVLYDGVDENCDGANDYDGDEDGFEAEEYGGDDCDDRNPTVHPGATERLYDGLDSDCDGAADYDADGDGFDAISFGGDDCDDHAADVYPGAPDSWYDGLDSDCGSNDDFDADGDGLDATAYGGIDCKDDAPGIHPGAFDTPYDGIDEDCDGADRIDSDGDGYDAADYGGTDCNDLSRAIHPGATDPLYDGIDGDCDGASDYDGDRDGYDATLYGGGDCKDDAPSVHPGATELYYDGVDQNCDSKSDYDADGDGYDAVHYGGRDRDDHDATVHPPLPAAPEADAGDGESSGDAHGPFSDRGRSGRSTGAASRDGLPK